MAGYSDHAARRQAKRSGRERGCWIYIPAEDLARAGMDADAPVYYRLWARPHSRSTGTAVVRLYAER